MRLAAIGFGFAILIVSSSAFAAEEPEVNNVTVAELITEPDTWHEREVAVIGELVGDYSRRDDGVWVQINGDLYTDEPLTEGGDPVGANIGMGARVPSAVFQEGVRGAPGHYGRIGPRVRLIGIFRHNDQELTGETYLDVETLELLEEARSIPTPGADLWLWAGLALVLAAAGSTVRSRRREKSRVS